MNYLAACYTNVGIKKQTNQDSMLIMQALADGKPILLAVVCDGMGGLAKGELASSTVVKALQKWFREDLPLLLRGDKFESQLYSVWNNLAGNVHRRIYAYGKKNNMKLGTTITAALFVLDRYYILHVGDCRVYEISDKVTQITKDQTLVEQEVERGALTLEQARTDRRRSVLLQCIGASEFVQPEFYKGQVKADAEYLLCSDGFRHEITDQELFAAFEPARLGNEELMEKSIEKVAKTVMGRGERDNISAILIHT